MKTKLIFILAILVSAPGYGAVERDYPYRQEEPKSISLAVFNALLNGIVMESKKASLVRQDSIQLAGKTGFASGGGTPFKNVEEIEDEGSENRQ